MGTYKAREWLEEFTTPLRRPPPIRDSRIERFDGSRGESGCHCAQPVSVFLKREER